LLTHLAESLPDNEALVYWERDLRLTFSQLEAEARLIARGLMALCVERGERVTVWATNVPEWIVLQFALAKIGAILVTANTGLRKQEIDYLLRQSQSATVITIQGFKDVDYVNALSEIGAAGDLQSPYLNRAIFIGDNCPPGFTAYQSVREIAASTSEDELVARENHVDPDNVINMQYTSGTTDWLGQGLGYSPQDRLSLCVPLFHCFGCVIGVLGAYTHGACLCPIEYFDPLKVLQTIERERCSSLYGVPTMFLAEMEHPQFKNFNLSSLRTGVMAGALCPEPLMKRAIDEMNLREITIIYGLTEASPGITQTLSNDTIEHRTRTVGKVLPEMEVKIIDPITRLSRGADQSGELCVRGYNVMKGYYNNPEATHEAIDKDGWLHSGDQAIIDSDGYVRITGRIKDIIIRGGENIAPKEIEDLLREHYAVLDAYVYAVSSEFFGEEVAAAVKLKQGMSASEEDLMDFCNGRIARFKVPRHFRFVDDFPMTASGKIQKFKLREMHEEKIGNKRRSTEQTEKTD
jgi:fatty-acyl-CoA synthase